MEEITPRNNAMNEPASVPFAAYEAVGARAERSQIAQTAQIQRGQTAEVDALYARLRDCPVPTMPVYGMQPIFTCPQNNGCGCGCNGGNF